jgi:uroporphyrin-3 C-methyltransferase
LSTLQRAIAKDIDRVKSFSLADTPNLLIQFDEMMRLMDELPLINDVIKPKHKTPPASMEPSSLGGGSSVAVQSTQGLKDAAGVSAVATHEHSSWAQGLSQAWWQKALNSVWQEFKGLVRVSQIDQPQSILLSPEQAYFVRENLKLRLLNARMALLARQIDAAKADASFVQTEIQRYFDLHQKNTTVAIGVLQNIHLNLKQLQLPPLTETFSAIAQTQAQSGR